MAVGVDGRIWCVFDLDGTLVDSLPDMAESLNLMLAHFGRSALASAAVRPMIGDGVATLVGRALAAVGAEDLDRSAALARYLAIYEPRATRLTRLFPGAVEALAQLRAAGVGLAVCTNKPIGAARDILGRLGVLELMEGVAGGDSFPVRKPDPEHVRRTLDLVGGAAGRAVMVGDHANDVAAGGGAGLRTIFAGWGYGEAAMARGADATAATIAAVPDLLTRLMIT